MTYIANWRFPKPKPQQVLTTATATRLRRQGVTEVKLAWGWRRLRMTLSAGYRSVWGSRQPPTGRPS